MSTTLVATGEGFVAPGPIIFDFPGINGSEVTKPILAVTLSVVILEQDAIGSGASGRNAGFGMTLFGHCLSVMRLRIGAASAPGAPLHGAGRRSSLGPHPGAGAGL